MNLEEANVGMEINQPQWSDMQINIVIDHVITKLNLVKICTATNIKQTDKIMPDQLFGSYSLSHWCRDDD